jgi:Sec-independent protein translocase protein TatA
MTEEKLDEITQQFGGAKDSFQGMLEDEDEDLEEEDGPGRYGRGAKPSPREELERRLADARARRRSPADLEEPLA